MRRAQYASVATLALVAACHANRVQHAAQPVAGEQAPATVQPSAADAKEPERTAAAAPAPACDLNDTQHLFLVHTSDGQIVWKSSAAECSTVLVQHVSDELYDAELELLWYSDQEDTLRVLDLRAPSSEPVAIARGMPGGNLRVSRGDHLAAVEDGCDVPYVSLDWEKRPKIETFFIEAPDLELVNTDWLRAQLKRRLRSVGERQMFSEEVMSLPKSVPECDFEPSCGTTVPFGAKGLQLVRVVESAGGDCVVRSCSLYDPQGQRWASPLRPAAWRAADSASQGPCGLYMFDRARSAYLIKRWLCTLERGCQSLGGYAIGWREPGDIIGEPGMGEWEKP